MERQQRDPVVESPDNEEARGRLTGDRRARRLKRFWRTLPSPPRCKFCNSPFGPPFGPVLRIVGKGRWPGNPSYCSGCYRWLYTHREGAEIGCTLFFADIRGSTRLGEQLRPNEFRTLLDRFYGTAFDVLIDHEAVVDKYVGDEVIGIFIPALTGAEHARRAVDAGLALLRATGNNTATPWLPIGIGVNTGIAYVGVVGTAEHVEFTALGDAVNVAARLASAAKTGEMLITAETAAAAALPLDSLEHRRLELKGKSESTEALVLTS